MAVAMYNNEVIQYAYIGKEKRMEVRTENLMRMIQVKQIKEEEIDSYSKEQLEDWKNEGVEIDIIYKDPSHNRIFKVPTSPGVKKESKNAL